MVGRSAICALPSATQSGRRDSLVALATTQKDKNKREPTGAAKTRADCGAGSIALAEFKWRAQKIRLKISNYKIVRSSRVLVRARATVESPLATNEPKRRAYFRAAGSFVPLLTSAGAVLADHKSRRREADRMAASTSSFRVSWSHRRRRRLEIVDEFRPTRKTNNGRDRPTDCLRSLENLALGA